MEEYIQDKLSNLLNALGVEFNHIDIQEGKNLSEENQYMINIATSEASLLIGKKGNNIIALQHILKQLMKKKFPTLRINLDVDSYKKRQIENTLGITERHVQKVRESHKTVSLPPMTHYYRRIVHIFIDRNYPDILTESAGLKEGRHVILKPKA